MGPQGSILVDKNIHALMNGPKPCVVADRADVRPCSLDLRVGNRIIQVAGRPSLAQGFRFQSFVDQYAYNDFGEGSERVTLTPPGVYITELTAEFRLPKSVWGYINPKSSSGRIDLECVVLAEGGTGFNVVPEGYEGRLYMLMMPRSFSVRDVCGQDFAQLRFYEGPRRILHGHELDMLHDKYGLGTGEIVDDGLLIHLDLHSYTPANLVAVRSGKPISVRTRDLDPEHYFRVKKLDSERRLFLEARDFLLAGTMGGIRVPPCVCAEMVPYVDTLGEFRSHYAGFFDPGFGYGEKGEARAATGVCEIRNTAESAIILSHGQAIAKLRFEYLREPVDTVYGMEKEKRSNYQSQQGVRTAKFFRQWPVVA